jgi:leader peptidase (prepilin peptidase)/N-methyltransferase
MDLQLFFLGAFFLLGAMIGSFLNVCIVRLPLGQSVVSPGSHCVKCARPVRWFDNIPLLSYLLLRGRCRDCGEGFSWRYPLIELLTGVFFSAFYFYFGLDLVLVPYLFMLSCFIVATFVDFEHRIIPDEVSLGGMFAGFCCSLAFPFLHPAVTSEEAYTTAVFTAVFVVTCLSMNYLYLLLRKIKVEREDVVYIVSCLAMALGQMGLAMFLKFFPGTGPWALSLALSLQGALIGGGLIYLMGVVGEWIFKKEAMGGGDVKLLAMVGAFMGWKLAVLTFFIAPFFGAVVGIVEKIRTKDSAIAYGPYLVLGALVSLFWGQRIISWVMTGQSLY